ncbi:MAG: DeoR/GlpR family DNA-binding transcription regulator [Vagococcus sp.]
MLKSERLSKIIELVNKEGVISATRLIETLNVSDMTIRRDLDELDALGKLVRVHGGAQSINYQKLIELSHDEKKEIHINEKINAARKAAQCISEDETIFFGPGTTIETIVDYLEVTNLRVITNSLSVFEKFQNKDKDYEIYLIGGNYRKKTRTFVGSIANEMLKNLKFDKSFIGVNGISETEISTYNIEEGSSQRIALDNSVMKIIVADHYKLDKEDFYQFYGLDDIDRIITDDNISSEQLTRYSNLVRIN